MWFRALEMWKVKNKVKKNEICSKALKSVIVLWTTGQTQTQKLISKIAILEQSCFLLGQKNKNSKCTSATSDRDTINSIWLQLK